MTGHEEQFRAIITYRKTRPYYPPVYRTYNHGSHAEMCDKDASEVGQVFTLEVGPYKTLPTVKGQVGRAKREYPLCSVYGDGLPSVEILSVQYQKAQYVVSWNEVVQ